MAWQVITLVTHRLIIGVIILVPRSFSSRKAAASSKTKTLVLLLDWWIHNFVNFDNNKHIPTYMDWWIHNNVLRIIANAIIKKLSERNKLGKVSKNKLQLLKLFVKEGASKHSLKSSKKFNGGKEVDYHWLSKGTDWKVYF